MLQPGPKVSTDPVCRFKAYMQTRLFGAGARTGAGMPPASFSTSTSSMWHGDDMYAAARGAQHYLWRECTVLRGTTASSRRATVTVTAPTAGPIPSTPRSESTPYHRRAQIHQDT